jgi:photosystem II stability/assembly factor-like uncharacterized protein
MAGRRKQTQARREERQRERERLRQEERERADRRRRLVGLLSAAVLAFAALGAVAAVIAGGGDDSGGGGGANLEHVHGLGVNPKDDALYVATHTGLFKVARGQSTARRVGESDQDVMGFSVLGPDGFLGSGHPGALQGGPPNLGLIRSDDAGRTWDTVSLSGEADFHVLRSKDDMVYGFNASSGSLMVSSDAGQSWEEHEPPGAMVDLAIDPADSSHAVASSEQGLVTSDDKGRSWRELGGGQLGLLTWPEPGSLYFIDGSGQVALSSDAGRRWKRMGSVGGQPAAFASAGSDLYAALPDGTVKRSTDRGATWSVRATP